MSAGTPGEAGKSFVPPSRLPRPALTTANSPLKSNIGAASKFARPPPGPETIQFLPVPSSQRDENNMPRPPARCRHSTFIPFVASPPRRFPRFSTARCASFSNYGDLMLPAGAYRLFFSTRRDCMSPGREMNFDKERWLSLKGRGRHFRGRSGVVESAVPLFCAR